MKHLYKIVRALIVVIITILILLPAVIYIGVTLPPVQHRLASLTATELSTLLGADVRVGSLSVSPFNRVLLRDVTVTNREASDTAMTVERLGAGVNLYELTFNRHLIINYIEIIGLDLRAHRDTLGAPLNIDPIIAKLKGDGGQPKSPISLAINTIVLRNSTLRYDVDSIPRPLSGHFSPHHVTVTDLSADVTAPAIGPEKTVVEVKRFKAHESSGLAITNLAGLLQLTPHSLSLKGLQLEMPSSSLVFNDLELRSDSVLSPDKLLLSAQLHDAGIAHGSYICPADLTPLVQQLKDFNTPLSLYAIVNGVIAQDIDISAGASTPSGEVTVDLSATLEAPLVPTRSIKNGQLAIYGNTRYVADLTGLPASSSRYIEPLEYADLKATFSGNMSHAQIDADLTSALGKLSAKAKGASLDTPTPHLDIDVAASEIALGTLLDNKDLDMASADLSAAGTLRHGRLYGEALANISRLDWRGHPYGDIDATINLQGDDFEGEIHSDDAAARFAITATGNLGKGEKHLALHNVSPRIDIGEISNNPKYQDHLLSMAGDVDFTWTDLDDLEGYARISDINYRRPGHSTVEVDRVSLSMATDANTGVKVATLASPFIEGEARGNIYPSTLVAQCRDILYDILPALNPKADAKELASAPLTDAERNNTFVYNFTINDTEQWADELKFPVSNLGHSYLSGRVDYTTRAITLQLDAPYLRQGNKLIEKTRLEMEATGDLSTPYATVALSTCYPTKHGPLTLDIESSAISDSILTGINWDIDRAARYDGRLAFGALLKRFDSHTLGGRVDIHPGELTFNDSTWTVNPGSVTFDGNIINVDGLNAHRSGQFVKIDGRVSDNPTDILKVDLLGIDLGYIFESLSIDNVMLGGDATGRFYAEGLLSPEPRIETPGLSVRQISYNRVPLGDALVKSHWDGDNRAITLDAVIEQENGLKSLVDGAIYPLNDSLDITFDCHDVNVAFMKHYMSTFASDVSGRATGKVRLWGNFKYIDIEGDVKADDFKIKIAFTNTSYATSDSVKLRLGDITLNNITISDIYGNKARLNGHVWHKYFKEPVFDFVISDAHNMLVYDETRRQNPDWYGRIFANGGARIDGHPGVVNIGVNMATAAGSTFTFVLNDMEEASDYTFITFRDRNVLALGEQETLVDDTPSTVKRLRQMLAQGADDAASDYNIDLMMDITPQAQINLIMDPKAGDNIRSRGIGNLRMSYGSSDNELHMWGTYTLDQGNYNFSLQDIILRDFTIKPGSSISFSGDPFSAMLDINAAYSLTANLSELDESFTQDKDLNRTTVPVNAILKVTGALQQPEIGFDLEFPTLTQDTYRKVRSIVSTDEMMNRQIIYLLALSRFYTPDYMDSATRGNELVSVASSTISSQLGNILGSLSDNWNIAPTFRSDRGDFSDLEVDVALSSSLLNNRLLFNGNFGYRDKTLNTTQFVGDFDIEYLLNRPGTLRLKAYNRYNDMNYYVRTAETTQGVGITFRRNFDTIADFLGLTRKH